MYSGLNNNVISSNHFENSVHPQFRYNVEWSIDIETEVWIQSLNSDSSLGVKINYSPSLVSLVVSSSGHDHVSFSVFAIYQWENLSVLNISEVIASVSEELPPIRVSAPDLHVVMASGSTIAHNVEWPTSSPVWLDGLSFVVEPPGLRASTIWSLDDKLSAIDNIKVFALAIHWDNMEWSLDVESPFFVQITLLKSRSHMINILDIPLHTKLATSVSYHDISMFSVQVALYIKDLSSLVHDVMSLQSPQLPPSWVSSIHTNISWSSIALDFHRSTSPVIGLDSLSNLIECELLGVSVSDKSFDYKVVSANAFNYSSHW